MPKPNLVYLERVAEVQRITKEEQTRTGKSLYKISRMMMDASRKEALCLLRDLGLYQKPYSETSREFFARVDAFVSQPRIAGKPFRFLTIAELRKLCKKLRLLQLKGVKVAERPRILSNLKPS